MNGLYLVIISALVFVLAYRFYGAFIAAKVLTVNQYKVTPAFRFEDGHDYVPTNKYVVFGHHFAAIAGAGPLVGPCHPLKGRFYLGLQKLRRRCDERHGFYRIRFACHDDQRSGKS